MSEKTNLNDELDSELKSKAAGPDVKKEEAEAKRLDNELKRLEIEERKQALESKQVSDELARIQLGEKRQELETKRGQKAKGKQDAEQAIRDQKAMRDVCNHHTGGDGSLGIKMGQGDPNRPACLGGIQFLDGTIRLRCQRCGKPWRSNLPNGDHEHGPWAEGVTLWKNNQNKTFAIVGGLKVTPVQTIS